MATGADEAEVPPRLTAASLLDPFERFKFPAKAAGFWRKFGAFAGPGYLVSASP